RALQRFPTRRSSDLSESSWQQSLDVDRLGFVLRRTFRLAGDGQARDAVEVVVRVFPGAGDQQVFLLIHQVLALVFAHLEIRRQLDRKSTRLNSNHVT